MNRNPEFKSAAGPIEPLEPGRPDVIPTPPPGGDKIPSREGEVPLKRDDDEPVEDEMEDVDLNNSVNEEHPPTR